MRIFFGRFMFHYFLANQSDKEGEKRRTRKENQLLLQLYLIVGSFLFGYGPKISSDTGSLRKNQRW